MFIAPQTKIARFFIIITIIVLILTILGLIKEFYKATIIITARPSDIEGVFNRSVKAKIVSIEKEAEETFVPKSLVTMEDYATGEVTIINNSNQDQVLVEKTRLLSPDGLIFRLTKRVFIPAGQKVRATVRADKMGDEYDIPPTKFTIPGLSPILQEKIYAESKTPMTGGVKKAGIITQKDLDNARDLMKEKLLNESLEELKQKFSITAIDKIVIYPEVIAFKADAKAGDEKDSFTAKLTIKVSAIFVNEEMLLDQAKEELSKKLTEDQEILNINRETFTYRVKSYDEEKQNTIFELYLTGRSILSPQSNKLSKDKFTNLRAKEVENYLLNIEGVESARVKISPFFFKKTPNSEKRIYIKIKSS
jgi:hypothetical protein